MVTYGLWFWKGGVTKTTSALNCAGTLHEAGFNVGVVDLEPQANLTGLAGYDVEELDPAYTAAGALVPEEYGDVDPDERLVDAPWGGWLLPGSPELDGAARDLEGLPGPHVRLNRALRAYEARTDFVFIDGPPRSGKLVFNIFNACDHLLIPCELSAASAQELPRAFRTIELYERYEDEVQFAGIIPTLAENNNHSAEVLGGLLDVYGRDVLQPAIRRRVAVKDAAAMGLATVQYDAASPFVREWVRLLATILERTDQRAAAAKLRKTFPAKVAS